VDTNFHDTNFCEAVVDTNFHDTNFCEAVGAHAARQSRATFA
jgi:hypothetical protein